MKKKKFSKKWLLLLLIPAFFGTMLTIRHFTGICPCKVVLNKITSTFTGKPCKVCEEAKEIEKKTKKVQEVINSDKEVQTYNVVHDESDNTDWVKGKLTIGSKTYTSPFHLTEFEKDGYKITEFEHRDKLAQHEVASYRVEKGKTSLFVTARNNTTADKDPKDCDVYIVSVSQSDQVLSDNLKIGDKEDDVLKVLGQPNTSQGQDGTELLMYISPLTGYNLSLTFVDGELFSYQYVLNGVQDQGQITPQGNPEESNEKNSN